MNKSYTTSNHVKKTLRSLPVIYKPKFITIHKAKYLNIISLKSLISNLESHELQLNGYEEPTKKSNLWL